MDSINILERVFIHMNFNFLSTFNIRIYDNEKKKMNSLENIVGLIENKEVP